MDTNKINLQFVIEQIESRCLTQGWTVGTAESCTGGLVAATIAARAGVSAWFVGGIVSYARRVKIRVLGVSQPLILTNGEVSREVAREMALGARRNLPCSWAVSITGIAGPGGGSPQKPVGSVAFGVAGPTGFWTEWRVFPGDRNEIQNAATQFALEYLLESMTR